MEGKKKGEKGGKKLLDFDLKETENEKGKGEKGEKGEKGKKEGMLGEAEEGLVRARVAFFVKVAEGFFFFFFFFFFLLLLPFFFFSLFPFPLFFFFFFLTN